MDPLAEKIDAKLRAWRPEVATDVRARLDEIIELADLDVLDIGHSRVIEDEVMAIIDGDPTPR
ncbi:MAG: hypothetical protein FJW38_14695 [Acidobacteria bacterium]|nr:hypothetical protein [Acidobacteriota bacterium]